jgi:hypothetical protein
MAKRPKPAVPPEAEDKEQSERFIDAAREVETTDSSIDFEDAFKAVTAPRRGPSLKRTSRSRGSLRKDE